MLTLKLNDAAVHTLGIAGGRQGIEPPGGLAAPLQARIQRGIVRRGSVLTWADSAGAAEDAPAALGDLTGWECADSSFHIEDFVEVDVATADDAPLIAEPDQRTLLLHGMAFALQFSRLIYELEPPNSVRCIIGANRTIATFRFHQIRQGEHWNRPDLDRYLQDKIVVLDIEPLRNDAEAHGAPTQAGDPSL